MNRFRLIAISISCILVGALMFLMQKNWIVVYWNFGTVESTNPLQKTNVSNRKKVKVYFWKDNKFKNEEIIIIWSPENIHENLKHIVNAWLNTQLDEKIFIKKIDLENTTISQQEQEAFIDLNHTFSWNEWSIHRKYKLIESLLKTVKNALPEIRYLNLLVNGKPLEDSHLSFITPWPTDGFEN